MPRGVLASPILSWMFCLGADFVLGVDIFQDVELPRSPGRQYPGDVFVVNELALLCE